MLIVDGLVVLRVLVLLLFVLFGVVVDVGVGVVFEFEVGAWR